MMGECFNDVQILCLSPAKQASSKAVESGPASLSEFSIYQTLRHER